MIKTNDITDSLQQLLVILLVIGATFYLQELPGSNVLQTALPEWPFILTLYFSVSSRYFFGVVSAFVVGVIEDVFLGVPTLGLHAIIYTLASFFIILIRFRFRQYSVFLQSMIIGFLVLLKVFFFLVYNSILYSFPAYYWVLLSLPASVLTWPLVHLFFAYFANRTEV